MNKEIEADNGSMAVHQFVDGAYGVFLGSHDSPVMTVRFHGRFEGIGDERKVAMAMHALIPLYEGYEDESKCIELIRQIKQKCEANE